MVPFKADITVERPVEQVFNFVADPQNYSQWMGGVSRAEAKSTPLRNGSIVQLAGRFGMWNIDAPFQITSFQPNREFGMKGAAGPFWFEGTWKFSGEGATTRLSVEGLYRMSGGWRLVEPLFAGEVKNGEANELKKIKALLEKGG